MFRKMRVGLDLLFLIPGEVGGTETYAMCLLEALLRATPDHEFVCFVNPRVGAGLVGAGGRCQVEVLPFDPHRRTVRYYVQQVILPRKVIKTGVDLLHSLAYVSPVKIPVPSVVTIHDLNFRRVQMPLLRRFVLGHFVKASALKADHIITVSHFSASEIVSHLGIPSNKVTVVHEAPPSLPDSTADIPKELASRRYILSLSGRSPHKNISRLISAFFKVREYMPDLLLVIAGHNPPGASHGLPGVVFLGYVPRNVLYGLYRGAIAFTMPSLYEGFGLPVLEAMSQGTPVCCSTAGALPEVCGDAALYFDPHDTHSIANTILSVVGNDHLRAVLSRRGLDRASEFSWDRAARETIAVYERVFASKLRARN